MNREIAKRLAIQSGIDLEFFQAGEVFQFAHAIAKQAIEDYKSSLVPVGTTYVSNSGYMEVELHKTVNKGVPLYALGETK